MAVLGSGSWPACGVPKLRHERFELVELYADGETVVEVVAAAGKARATGTPFASEVVRIWTFRNGKAVRVRSYYDTHLRQIALMSSNDAPA